MIATSRAARTLLAAAAAALALGHRAQADVDFARDVLPILEERCFKCHAGDRPKGGLRLDARKRALRGGNSGEKAIVPGRPEQSRLLHLVRGEVEGEVMPPVGRRLAAEQIATLERWIAAGAPWPDELSGDELVREHWAFVKPARPRLPPAAEARAWWPRNEIDFFTLAAMTALGLEPSPEADRRTLARRLALDLTGLPPAPEAVEAFAADRSPDAYERHVRSLLASPRYGERWARMWLDLARYADSAGYGSDPLRPFLWRWRDWVIDAFNANRPWDRFTVEQLAGDLLPEPTLDQLLATAFHRNTMTNTEGGTDDEEFRVAAVKDRVDTTMQIWMGLTVGCAKCHSHKFDPIPHKDYYRLFALFNQTEDADRADEEPRLPTPTPEQAARRDELLARVAEVAARRDAAAADLAPGLARWMREVEEEERRWIALVPTAARSEAGAELDVGRDGTVRAGGPAPATDVYVIEAEAPLEGITALRLEALPDPGLPRHGPGRSAENGNFVLNDVQVAVVPRSREPRRARWIRIELPGERRILSLAEVQLFAGSENVAPGGAATQSSVDFGGAPELAVDGNVDGHYFDARSTTHTREGADPWWELDLGASRPIDRVAVWNRSDHGLEARLAGARVSLFDEPAPGAGGAVRVPVWQAVLVDAPAPSAELDPAGPSSVVLARASADFEQDRFFVAQAIDASAQAASGWAIAPRQGARHVAIFETLHPIAPRAGAPARGGSRAPLLRVELHQTWGDRHTLGRFRISVCAGADPPHALPEPVALALAKPAAARTGDEEKRLADHYRGVAPELAPFAQELAPLESELAALDREIVRTPVLRELPAAMRRRSHVLLKSNHLMPGEEVEPAVPAFFHPFPEGAPRDRLGLALWLVSPENPLTARVAVNRFWAQLFERGLVETEEDFGTQGTPPSHPELLDWLAIRFVESGWDVKELLFTIVTSATWRQSSAADPSRLERDPRNVWLSRSPRRRLEAEMVRDQALAVAGLLSPRIHGPSVYPPQPDDLWQAAFNGERTYPTSSGEERWRRGLYTFWRRTVPPPSMQTFDAPSREYCAIRRQATNTPLQALVTLNDPVFVEAAQALARRIVLEGGAKPRERAAFALELALGRPARAQELDLLAELFESELARARASDPAAARALAEQPLGPLPPGMDPAELAAWTSAANVVLNLDAVLTRN